jgi:hypothetical protein
MDEEQEEVLYDIVRFYKNGGQKVIEEDVMLEYAKEHCNDPESHGDGWFDGFRKS